MNFIITDDLRLDINEEPNCDIRETYPKDTKEVKDDKKRLPFILNNELYIDGLYLFKDQCNISRYFGFTLNIPKGFKWDGATIPRGFWWIIGGKGSPEFLIASLFHDYICKNKYLMKGNRYLSSLLFKEVLIACGVPTWKATIMFHAVDNFQKLFKW